MISFKKVALLTLLLLPKPVKSMQSLLESLTLEQKIAQLFMVAVVSDEGMNEAFMTKSPYRMDRAHVEGLIKKYEIGNIILMGKGTTKSTRDCIDRLQGLAKIPLFVGIDAEWGLSQRLGDTLRFPHAMTLGALANKQDPRIHELGQLIGFSCKELGIDINFAPVIDVNINSANPIIGTRSFGENPARVASKAMQFARGLQNAGVLACAKHFPGHGDTSIDSHVTLPTIAHNRARLDAIELRPYRELIKQGVAAIMTAHLAVPALDPEQPCSLSNQVVTNLLQKELKFEGLIITDGLGMGALRERLEPGHIELQALLAGNDLLLGMLDVPLAIELIKEAIEDGKIATQEIDRRVLKILQAKEWVRYKRPVSKSLPSAIDLKKTLYKEAVTVVKNHQRLLPLKTNRSINVQTYGTLPCAKFSETLKHHLHIIEEASTVVLAVYPIAKARMIDEMADEQSADAPISIAQTIIDLHARNKKVIAMLFDTPYRIPEIKDADAIICAYEDDTDAQYSAALAMLGYYNPSGALPVSVGEFPAGTSLNYTTLP